FGTRWSRRPACLAPRHRSRW
ncbi:hypothetical protein NJB18185_21370, partial [Mycobacterium montefiorense]